MRDDISGSVGSRDSTEDGAEMVRSLAQKLHAPSRFLHAPLFMQSESFANSLMSDQANIETLALASQLDVALVGAGTTNSVSSGLRRACYPDESDLRALHWREQASTDPCSPARSPYQHSGDGCCHRQSCALPASKRVKFIGV